MAAQLAESLGKSPSRKISVVDPFCGDGRLLIWFLEAWSHRDIALHVEAWDIDQELVKTTKSRLLKKMAELGQKGEVVTKFGDSFVTALNHFDCFDFVITNPPWDVLKPDQRRLKSLPHVEQQKYVENLREVDRSLSLYFPEAQPSKKFAGWGTNLSRVGLAASMKIAKPTANISIVMPASLVADSSHANLRSWITTISEISELSSYPAEAKLFEKVDVHFVTAFFQKGLISDQPVNLIRVNASREIESSNFIPQPNPGVADWKFPIHPGCIPTELMDKISHLPTLESLLDGEGFWAGRELDETGLQDKLRPEGLQILRGRNIHRFFYDSSPSIYVSNDFANRFRSTQRPRIAWRDISRPSQQRRVQASLVPPGVITGNSVGVLAVAGDDEELLSGLLGIFNSAAFEAQLRTVLATGHVTLASLKKIHIPKIEQKHFSRIAELSKQLQERRNPEISINLEIAVCDAYGFSAADRDKLFSSYAWIDSDTYLLELDPA